MPIYEYQCPTCKERFEKLVRSSASAAEVSCPTCGASGAKRMVSTFASIGLSTGSGSGASSCAPSGGG